MEQNLNHVERIEKAESLLLNRIPRGKNKEIALKFKKLVSGLNISREFFLKDLNQLGFITDKKKKKSIYEKINTLIELAEIKTNNVFFYKENGLNCGVTIDCFIILL